MFKIATNKDKNLCQAYRCGNKHTLKDRFCSKHRKRYEKENNFLAYTFNSLKSNAKRRGKDFSLTIEEFKLFCAETNYLALKGRMASSASIDRIRPGEGYHKDNIQILSLSNNSKKGTAEDFDDCPF